MEKSTQADLFRSSTVRAARGAKSMAQWTAAIREVAVNELVELRKSHNQLAVENRRLQAKIDELQGILARHAGRHQINT